MEIIESIENTSFKAQNYFGGTSEFDGFVITTDKQQIKLGIYNGQNCCEHWGYFMTNDYIEGFIGAGVLEIKQVDDCLNVTVLEANDAKSAATMFVNIETTKGTLQFTAYNDHNGYYSHEAVVISKHFNTSESL